MKVVIGPYKSWIGPYQIAEKLLWWMDKHEDPRVHSFGTWLAEDKHGNDSWLTKACQWVDSKRKRQIYVRIDHYDVWSMDNTLAHIALPMLKLLQQRKHGAPLVDDADVPDHLKSTAAPAKENEWDTDDNHFLRWDWVLAEMIWAFEQEVTDNDTDQFYDHTAVDESADLNKQISQIKCDRPALLAHEARKQRGFQLFGKYYQSLWD